jgi:hypothetical protein
MMKSPLHVRDGVAGVTFVLTPVDVLGYGAELDYQDVGQVCGLGLSAFLLPQLHQGGLVGAHDGPGVGTANE